MREFEFLAPASVPEATRMLADLGEDARVIAGGTALLLAMRQRMLAPSHLVSLGRIETLRGIAWDDRTGLRIGALTPHADVAASPLVRKHYPMLSAMAVRMANPQVRNQGTLGGNLCYADPATDPPTCLMALGAQVVLGGTAGERLLSMEEFLVDYYTTALEPAELVTEIRVPPPAEDLSGHYLRFLRTAAEHRPLVNVAVTARHEGRLCRRARLVVGGSTAVPSRMARAEAFLEGQTLTHAVAAEAADMAAADIVAISDLRGSEDYRRDMVRVVARRALSGLFRLDEN